MDKKDLTKDLTIVSACVLVLSQLFSMIVPLFYFYSKTCRHHPAKIIVILCNKSRISNSKGILEMISTYQFFMQSICYQINIKDWFKFIVDTYTFSFTLNNGISENLMSLLMCWFNQSIYTICLYAQIGYYISLCVDLMITMQKPFWPGQSRVIWYHCFVFLLTVGFSIVAFTDTIEKNCRIECSTSAATDSSPIVAFKDTIQRNCQVECLTNAPDLSFLAIQCILLIVAITSIILGGFDIIRKRHQNKMIKNTRIKFFKNHIILLVILLILWGPVCFLTYIDTIKDTKFSFTISDDSYNYLLQASIILIIAHPILLSLQRFSDPYFSQSISFFIKKIRGSLTFEETQQEKHRQSLDKKGNDNWLIPIREMVQLQTDQETIENILSCIVEVHKERIDQKIQQFSDEDIRKLSNIKNQKRQKFFETIFQNEDIRKGTYMMNVQDKLNESLSQIHQHVVDLANDSQQNQEPQIQLQEPLLLSESRSHKNRKKNQTFYSIKEYAPMIFENLREQDNISVRTLIDSLNPINNQDQIKKVKESLGRSGSFLFFSKDRKFLLKTMQKSELDSLINSILKKYYLHIKSNPKSLISRIYAGISSVHLVLLENTLEYFPKNNVKLYDLKGSLKNRRTLIDNNSRESFPFSKSQVCPIIYPIENPANANVVYKDQNFLVSSDLFIQIGSAQRDKFIRQMELDTDFLRQCQIMDYSLLVAIYQEVDAHSNISLNSVIRTSNTKVPRNEFRKVSGIDKFFYSFSIIDILQQYNCRKKFENLYKTDILKKKNISCVNPEQYSSRFLSFMNMIVASIVD